MIRDVDRMLGERGKGNDRQSSFMCRSQDNVGSDAIAVGPQPVRRRHAPPVAWHEARKLVLRHRSAQIVADATLMIKEFSGDHRAYCVATQVLGPGTAAPVPVEAGDRVSATGLKLTAKHVAIDHPSSIAPRACITRTAPGHVGSRLGMALGLVRGVAKIGVVRHVEAVLAQPRRPDVVGVSNHGKDAAAEDQQDHHDREPGGCGGQRQQ